jgi:hypothetical protein
VVEVHGPTVPQNVWTEESVGERRIGCLGSVFVKDPCDPAAAEFAAVLVEEHWMIIMTGASRCRSVR